MLSHERTARYARDLVADGEDGRMPIIQIDIWEGRSIEQKRRLAREVTNVVSTAIDCDPSTVRILIREYARENWAVAGTLQIDR
jgi:4-oxalocrotonate tautomerase